MYTFLLVIYVIVCLVLIVVILLQAGRGGGLSGLFGGAGQTQTIFGARASDFLTRTTRVCAVIFLTLCVVFAIFSAKRTKSLMLDVEEPVVAETAPESAQVIPPPSEVTSESIEDITEPPPVSEELPEVPEPLENETPAQ